MASIFTFKGGVKVAELKNTRRSSIVRMTPPQVLVIPLTQHIGRPAQACVKPGDTVDMGQPIGIMPEGELGGIVHSSVSGRVTEIRSATTPSGDTIQHVVIENDFEDRLWSGVTPFTKRLQDTTADEIIEVIKNAGITGMGGAMFPTHEKTRTSLGRVKHLFINCAECEPYITANHRLLLEQPEAVLGGTKILLKAFGLRHADIAVEDNKLDVANLLDKLTVSTDLFRIRVMKTKYPQGDERQLIYALIGVEVPTGKFPADVGCVVFNAETAAAVYNAFAAGMPMIERIVTVDGDCIKKPMNLSVRIGTPFSEVIKYCGGLKRPIVKLISGGPMMGSAQWDIDTPVIKGTNGIIALSKKQTETIPETAACIRCGRCVGVCPMHLMPTYFAAYAAAGELEMCEKFDVMSCVECGACSYVCPGSVPIVQYNRMAKAKLREMKQTMQTAREAASTVKPVPEPKAETADNNTANNNEENKPSDGGESDGSR
nr:electron transport complex subunit RsxC [Clostridia bacterium]